MRHYTRLLHRELERRNQNVVAVCPFPGRAPLRLAWSIVPERHHPAFGDPTKPIPKPVSYYGKFTPGAWLRYKQIFAKMCAKYLVTSNWELFDKLRMVAEGYGPYQSNMTTRQMVNLTHQFERYFYGTIRRTVLYPESVFDGLRLIKCGPYQVYTMREQVTDLERYGKGRTIAMLVPTVRNA